MMFILALAAPLEGRWAEDRGVMYGGGFSVGIRGRASEAAEDMI